MGSNCSNPYLTSHLSETDKQRIMDFFASGCFFQNQSPTHSSWAPAIPQMTVHLIRTCETVQELSAKISLPHSHYTMCH